MKMSLTRYRSRVRTSVSDSVLCSFFGSCPVLRMPQAYRATPDSLLLKFSLATRRNPPGVKSDARGCRDCDRGVHVYESEAVCRKSAVRSWRDRAPGVVWARGLGRICDSHA